jgi:hypothetical protein
LLLLLPRELLPRSGIPLLEDPDLLWRSPTWAVVVPLLEQRGVHPALPTPHRLLQRFNRLLGTAVEALHGRHSQQPQDEGIQWGAHARIQLTRAPRPALAPHLCPGLSRLRGRRIHVRHQPVRHHPQREQVIARAGRVVHRRVAQERIQERPRLGAPVPGRSRRQQLGGERARAPVMPRTKVREIGPAIPPLHQHIAAFHIPVEATHGVRGLQRSRHVQHPPQRLTLRGIASRRPVVQRLAVYPFHHKIGIAPGVMLPHALIIQPGHVRTVHVRQQPGLSLEALISRVGCQLERTRTGRLVPFPLHAVQRPIGSSAAEAHHAPGTDPQPYRQAERIHLLHRLLHPHGLSLR